MKYNCDACHLKTVRKLIEKFHPSEEVCKEIYATVNTYLDPQNQDSNPKVSQKVHRLIRESLGIEDLFVEEKFQANKVFLDQYDRWKRYILQSDNPQRTAIKLAVIGNIIDYGAHRARKDVEQQVDEWLDSPLAIDHCDALLEEVDKASKILYLGDNAGEIFFDRLLIEALAPEKTTFVTRGRAVINDVTYKEAEQIGMPKVCNVISNGSDAPSTLLDECSEDFLHAYHDADLIISKGQGNLEGLMHEKHPNTFFLFIAKCEPIAHFADAKVDDLIVKRCK